MDPGEDCGGGWATDPQDTRERTCEWPLPPAFCLRHRLRVDRSPAPESVTVTRTHRASVEWTADVDLPAWLRAVAQICTPYGRRGDDRDRFHTDPPGDPSSDDDAPILDRDADTDGRFRAAPVEATVRPPDGDGGGLSDPYHYWNTPLARLRSDEHYPDCVASATVEPVDGPDATWTGASAVGATVGTIPDLDVEAHSRVGLEVTTRERFRRDGGAWRAVDDTMSPELGGIAGLVEVTLAPAVRQRIGGQERDRALRTAVDRVAAVWRAFSLDGGDPYSIPESAVEAATAQSGDST